MSGATPYVMTGREIAWGYVPGLHPRTVTDHEPIGDPRQVLEQVVVEALRRPPCGVAFSGGRDSSTVLAVAVHVARREGLPEPIPVTKRFPRASDTIEDNWQELVIRHLGLAEWERLDFHDELDLVGPAAQSHLQRHGVLWPPLLHGDLPMLEMVPGGSLLDGEGGDDVLGVEFHRIAPLTELVMYPRLLNPRRVRRTLTALAPHAMRRPIVRRQLTAQPVPWLRPRAHRELIDVALEVELERPLSFERSLRDVPRRRAQVLLASNRKLIAQEYDVRILSPLLHPRVIAALGRSGGWLGPGGRTEMLQDLVPDLLPQAALKRTTKAMFNEAFMSTFSSEFVSRWTGGGLDDELVDTEVLRESWRSGNHSARTFALLQSAWLADQVSNDPTAATDSGAPGIDVEGETGHHLAASAPVGADDQGGIK